MNTFIAKESHLLEDQAFRRKRKITSFIFFFVLFTVIIGSIISVFIAIKQDAESESLSSGNPEKRIRAICNLTPSPKICVTSIWGLHSNIVNSGKIKTTPSRIFTLSLHVAFNQLTKSVSANQLAISKVKNPRILSALKSCDGLIRDSLTRINMSIAIMGVEPDDKIFRNSKKVNDLKGWINTTKNIDKCLTGLGDDLERLKKGNSEDLWTIKMKILDSKDYVVISSVILARMDTILSMFNQPMVASIIDHYNFLLTNLRNGYAYGMVFYCGQYLFLVVLICMVLRFY